VFPGSSAPKLLQRYAEASLAAPDALYIDSFVAYPRGKPAVCGFDV
jgi:hypothetical protein